MQKALVKRGKLLARRQLYQDRWLATVRRTFCEQTNTGALLEQLSTQTEAFIKSSHAEVCLVRGLSVEWRPVIVEGTVRFTSIENVKEFADLTVDEMTSAQFDKGFSSKHHIDAPSSAMYKARESK